MVCSTNCVLVSVNKTYKEKMSAFNLLHIKQNKEYLPNILRHFKNLMDKHFSSYHQANRIPIHVKIQHVNTASYKDSTNNLTDSALKSSQIQEC